MVLRKAGVDLAARLSAQLLCALAGGAAVGVLRVLLRRLEVADTRARLWTLLFGTSTTQIVFSSLPESYAFSALSLLLVFVVAAGPRPKGWARLAAGVGSFGVTCTNLVAVALARCSATCRRRLWRSLWPCAVHVGLVVAIAAVLSLVQHAIFHTSEPFFVPKRLPMAYVRSFFVPDTATEELERVAGVVSHVGFAGLAAPRLLVSEPRARGPAVDFADIAILTPTPVSAAHWLLWAVLLVQAGRGALARAQIQASVPPVITALVVWLLFLVTLHVVFGSSFFLYSGHWVFALVAVIAWAVEQRPLGGGLFTAVLLALLVCLQLVANAGLVRQMLGVFWSR